MIVNMLTCRHIVLQISRRYRRAASRLDVQNSDSINKEKESDVAIKRALKVAIVGDPNVGKSTLLNKLVGYPISGVSNKINTTQVNTLGILTEGNTQIEFIDSPGILERERANEFRLQVGICEEPALASNRADLIALMVDASAFTKTRSRLSFPAIQLLEKFKDKKSILILNKIDLVKEKRFLLTLTTRLTLNSVEGIENNIGYIPDEEKRSLNLLEVDEQFEAMKNKPKHKYVIELEPDRETKEPKPKGWKYFSRSFFISALNDSGIDELKKFLFEEAKQVDDWKYISNLVTPMKTKQIIHEVIRGKFMDNLDKTTPYNLKYKYLNCSFDKYANLQVILNVICSNKYDRNKLLSDNGVLLNNIISAARKDLQNIFGCDVIIKTAVVVNKIEARLTDAI